MAEEYKVKDGISSTANLSGLETQIQNASSLLDTINEMLAESGWEGKGNQTCQHLNRALTEYNKRINALVASLKEDLSNLEKDVDAFVGASDAVATFKQV